MKVHTGTKQWAGHRCKRGKGDCREQASTICRKRTVKKASNGPAGKEAEKSTQTKPVNQYGPRVSGLRTGGRGRQTPKNQEKEKEKRKTKMGWGKMKEEERKERKQFKRCVEMNTMKEIE